MLQAHISAGAQNIVDFFKYVHRPDTKPDSIEKDFLIIYNLLFATKLGARHFLMII